MTSRAAADSRWCRRGEVIAGCYRVGEVLGVGGMGVVYAAVQRSLDRTVALKLPRPDLTRDPTVRRRLRSEAIAGSQINHRNIVRVLDFGSDHDVPFIVMEHVAGPRLAQLVSELGPMPTRLVVGIARQIVAGLEAVHRHGVVHADVKCDNVLVEIQRDGTLVPCLIDFGIARCIADRTPFDAEQAMITGTPEYLAPEVISGEAPGFAADVYAIGVVLYELVTGSRPFGGGSSAEVMSRRLEGDVLPISLRCPDRDISPKLEAVILRALARDRSARFATATELGSALDKVWDELGAAEAIGLHVAAPPLFSTEAPTVRMSLDDLPTQRRRRAGSREGESVHAAITCSAVL